MPSKKKTAPLPDFQRDFRDMLGLLDSFGVEFLVVGGLALAVHAEPRSTKDLDLWVRATPDNAERLFAALKAFGAPLHGATPSDFATPGIGLQLGVPPARIDLLTQIDGVEFAAAWPRRLAASFDGVPAPVISREDLLTNKRAAGRPQDLVDVDAVEAKAPRKKKRERSR